MTTSEEWRPVVGYEGLYEVSSLGRVRSLDRTVTSKDGRSWTVPGRIKKPSAHNGYLYMCFSQGGVDTTVRVHRLVATAFLGDPGDGYEVCHIDGNPGNPALTNLYWGTRSDNMADAKAHGTMRNGRADQTHCKRGHEFTPENTRLGRGRSPIGPHRTCKTCERDLARERARRARSD